MGKIRVKTFGNEEEEAKAKAEKDRKRAEKKAREANVEEKTEEITPEAPKEETKSPTEETNQEAKQEVTPEAYIEETEGKPKKKAKKAKFAKKSRSANYSEKVMAIDKNKSYSLTEGLELLRKVKLSKFDETVELHINTVTSGISGQVKLPHGTGKEVRVAIASDEVLAEVEKGKIGFDILVASPAMMPRLAKVARILGPKGLMPNPKNGTISENPEEAAKKFQGGQMNFKTEAKEPLMHLIVGKTSFKDEQLQANIKTLVLAIRRERIQKVTLKSTMSPGIRVNV